MVEETDHVCPQAPANEIIEYELVTFSSGFKEGRTMYMADGNPTQKLDDNWNALYQSRRYLRDCGGYSC